MLELLQLDAAVEVMAKLRDRSGLAQVARGAALAAGESRAQARFSQAGLLRKIRQRGNGEIGGAYVLLLEDPRDRQTGNAIRAHRAIEFLLFDGGEKRMIVEKRDGGIRVETSDPKDEHSESFSFSRSVLNGKNSRSFRLCLEKPRSGGNYPRVEKLIGRENSKDTNLKIIAGDCRSPARRRVCFARRIAGSVTQRQHLESPVFLHRVKHRGLPFAETAEFAGAAVDFGGRNVAGNSRGSRACARRKREDVKIGERQALDKGHRCGVVFVGFARESGDDVSADRGVGQMLSNELDAAGVVLGAIPAMHGGQNAVGPGLQRHVKMLCDARSRRKQRNQILSDIQRLDRTDAQSLQRGPR